MTYTVEDLRDYITELYCDQQYTERQILTALLSHGVETNADQLRRHLELWQLNSAPSHGADPLQPPAERHVNPPIFSNDRLQQYLQEHHHHEQLALRLTSLTQNEEYDENIDLPEQPPPRQRERRGSDREQQRRQSRHRR